MTRGFAVGVLVGCILLASCSSEKVPGLDQASLGDAVLAIRTSPQATEIVEQGIRGRLILTNENGETRSFDAGGIDLDQVAWGRRGLHLSDTENEYLINSNGSQTLKRGAESLGVDGGRFLVNDNTEAVSAYNIGFKPEHYLFKISSTTENGVTVWDSPGMTFLTAQCGDKVFGVADLDTTKPPQNPTTNPEPGPNGYQNPEVLIQLYPEPKNIPNGIIGQVNLPGNYEQSGTGQACTDGVIYFISEKFATPHDASNTGRTVLRKWNTNTGEHNEVPLLNEQGENFRLSTAWPPDDHPSPGPNTSGISDDGRLLLWVSQKGLFHETDLTTGITKSRFKTQQSEENLLYTVMQLTSKALIVLEAEGTYPSFAFSLTSYDLNTGNRNILINLKNPLRIQPENVVRSIAINPEWLKNKGLT